MLAKLVPLLLHILCFRYKRVVKTLVFLRYSTRIWYCLCNSFIKNRMKLNFFISVFIEIMLQKTLRYVILYDSLKSNLYIYVIMYDYNNMFKNYLSLKSGLNIFNKLFRLSISTFVYLLMTVKTFQ